MKKKILIISSIIFIISLLLAGVIGCKLYIAHEKEMLKQEEQRKKVKEEKEMLKRILANYSEKVITTKDTKIYKLDKSGFVEIGQVNKDTNILLEKIEEPSKENEYFKLKNQEYYIYHDAVEPNEEMIIDNNYKNYVPFDSDIVTKNSAKMYLGEKEIYTINESLQLPIIINDNDSYHVDFNDKLVKIKKEDVEKTVENKRNIEVAIQIGVLNYHFFYDPSIGESCDQTICLTTQKFEEQLKYLKDNDFYTATTKDMALWMEKKIRLPKKTTLLTVDDGAQGTSKVNGNKLIPLLEKYDLQGTLFLITAWWPKENYLSPNLEIQSHGDNIHNYTGEALYKTKDQLLADFKLSIDKLDGEKTSLCYPFYAHNAIVRAAAKEAGFKIAFAGGHVKANQYNDPYQINRYVIMSYITMNEFIQMVS